MQQPKISLFHDGPVQLGEGPGYDPLTKTVWWFDIVTGRLFEKPLGWRYELKFMLLGKWRAPLLSSMRSGS